MTNVLLGGDELGAGDPEGLVPPAAGDSRQFTPEEYLLLGILEQAILDTQETRASGAPKRRGDRIHAEAEAWFAEPHNAWGSFCWICETLGLDPNYVLMHRAEWRVKGQRSRRRYGNKLSAREAA